MGKTNCPHFAPPPATFPDTSGRRFASTRNLLLDIIHHYAYLQMKVAGGGAECGQFILPIDSDRKMDYDIAPGFYSMQVHVVGWYI